MKVALIADIHGNLVALDTVLAAIDREQVDQIVCLGDVALLGPEPIPALERLEELGCPVIMGNTDEWILGEPEPFAGAGRDPILDDRMNWTIAQLTDRHRSFLRSFAPTLELDLGSGVRMVCFHGSPRSHSEGIGASTAVEDLKAAFDGQTATLMAGGHTHRQLLRRVDGQWLINPGSAGMTFRQTRVDREPEKPPWAEYGIVEVRNGAIDVSLRAVPLDVEQVVARARASGMPHAEWWAEGWLGRGGWD
jgi:putative phosphoesterase